MIASLDRRADHKPAQATILISAAIAGLVLLALVYLAAVAPRGVPLLPYYYVNAQFRNAENIRVLSTVQIAGRRATRSTPVCSVCRSDDIIAHATVQWSNESQEWELANTFGLPAHCNQCNAVCDMLWLPLN